MQPDPVRASMLRRLRLLQVMERNPAAQPVEREMCRRDPVHFVNSWCWTYDPRAASTGGAAYLPFDLFPRQVEMVRWLEERLAAKEDGLIEKSRDTGFTWTSAAYALHKWLFVDGFKTTFGSRKEEYVDRIGDPDSIFEKVRLLLYRLPRWMRPPGFQPASHDNHMRLLNPANGNTIRGEAGDQMGRGGRSTVYFIDEAAFIERAERVDAATSANTDVRIWGSTVNGAGNLFFRKRHGGLDPRQIFRFHWSDDPRKTLEWAEKKKATLDEHVWASEYDIDYAASVEGICIPAKWVEAAKRLRALLPDLQPSPAGIGGLDVGAGKAKSVYVSRFGSVVHVPLAWSDPDTIGTAHKGLDAAAEARDMRSDGDGCTVRTLLYDNVGVGVGVASALSYTSRPGIFVSGINTGDTPTETYWPDGETSVEKFANLKAEIWWIMRERCKAAFETVLHIETGGAEGHRHPASDCLALPSDAEGPDAAQLSAQLSMPRWFRNEKGKILIEKKEDLAKRGIASPDYAEALALTFAQGRDTAAEMYARMAQ